MSNLTRQTTVLRDKVKIQLLQAIRLQTLEEQRQIKTKSNQSSDLHFYEHIYSMYSIKEVHSYHFSGTQQHFFFCWRSALYHWQVCNFAPSKLLQSNQLLWYRLTLQPPRMCMLILLAAAGAAFWGISKKCHYLKDLKKKEKKSHPSYSVHLVTPVPYWTFCWVKSDWHALVKQRYSDFFCAWKSIAKSQTAYWLGTDKSHRLTPDFIRGLGEENFSCYFNYYLVLSFEWTKINSAENILLSLQRQRLMSKGH